MLKAIGATHVIIGHSERRQYFGETDDLINKKLKSALQHGLVPIVCVGEVLAEREAGKTEEVLLRQTRGVLASITPSAAAPIVIAYEPVWAIGTGKTATPQMAAEAHALIRKEVAKLFSPATADHLRILYGGSVKPDNATALMDEEDIDGALVGGASLDSWFGSRVTADGLGFLLNDEMDDFSTKPGVPNSDGLIQSDGECDRAGKTAAVVNDADYCCARRETLMVLGSPGSSKIITTVANVLMGVVDYGMNIQEAVNAPRFHHQWLPDVVNVEQWFSPDTVNLLQHMGYNVQWGCTMASLCAPYWSDAECIAVDAKTGERLGASDVRGGGKTVGY